MYVFLNRKVKINGEGKKKTKQKNTSIDGTARREKRAFCLTERSDLSEVASRNLKETCFAGICCR